VSSEVVGPFVIEAVLFLGFTGFENGVFLFLISDLLLEFFAVVFLEDHLGHGDAVSEEPGIEGRAYDRQDNTSDEPLTSGVEDEHTVPHAEGAGTDGGFHDKVHDSEGHG